MAPECRIEKIETTKNSPEMEIDGKYGEVGLTVSDASFHKIVSKFKFTPYLFKFRVSQNRPRIVYTKIYLSDHLIAFVSNLLFTITLFIVLGSLKHLSTTLQSTWDSRLLMQRIFSFSGHGYKWRAFQYPCQVNTF